MKSSSYKVTKEEERIVDREPSRLRNLSRGSSKGRRIIDCSPEPNSLQQNSLNIPNKYSSNEQVMSFKDKSDEDLEE